MSNLLTEATTQSPRTSHIGTPTGELSLRIHGAARDGQIVRMESGKCSIGSGDGCTLRLEAPGVQQLHCYILRGQGGTVVRRWAPETRLNGRAFRDSYLRGGDRLTVGSVEFEILSDEPSDETRTRRVGDRRVAELAAQLQELQSQHRHATQRYELDSEIWTAEKARLEEQLQAAVDAEREAAERLSDSSDEFAKRQAEAREALEHDKAQWSERVSQRQTELTDLEAALAETRTQLAEQTELLDETKAEFDAERSAFLRDRSLTQEQFDQRDIELKRRVDRLQSHEALLKSRAEELDTLQAGVQEKQAALEVEAQQLQDERKEFLAWRGQCESEFAAQRDELTAQQQQLASEADALNRERDALATRVVELENDAVSVSRFNEQRDQLQQQQAELQTRLAEFDAQSADVQSQREKLQQQFQALADEREQLSLRESEITRREQGVDNDVEMQQLEEQRQALSQLQDELNVRETELNTAKAQWDEQRESLERELIDLRNTSEAEAAQAQQLRDTLDQERVELQQQREALEATQRELVEKQDELQRQQEELTVEQPMVEADEFDEPEEVIEAETAPSEGMLALERLRKLAASNDDLDDDNFDDAGSLGGYGGGSLDDDYAAGSPVLDPAMDDNFGLGDQAPASGDGDELSIEDYMNQLMQRAQGKSEADDLAQGKTPAKKKAKPQAANEPTEVEPPKKVEKLTSLPSRKAAPEQASNLRAMRELANESARGAITTSSQQSAVRMVQGKFAIAAASAAMGVVMLAMADGIVSLSSAIALGCFAAAGWFGYDAVKSKAKLANAKPLRQIEDVIKP